MNMRKHIPTVKLKELKWSYFVQKLLSNWLNQSKSKNIYKTALGQGKRKSYTLNKSIYQDEGFTLIEVLIAGALIAMMMTAVSRLSIAAMANSKHQLDRDIIEAAINDNIQLIQQKDSLLEYEKLGDEEKKKACEDPAGYLQAKIEGEGKYNVPVPSTANKSGEVLVNRTFDTSKKEIATIIFSFKSPGSKTIANQDSAELLYETQLQKATEQRILDLNPNFQAECLPIEDDI